MDAVSRRAALLALLLASPCLTTWADEMPDDYEAPTPVPVPAQDAPPAPYVPEERRAEAVPVIGVPFDSFISAMGSYTLADEGRGTDDGFGGFFSVGKRLNEQLALELYGLYTSFDADGAGSHEAEISGGALGAMMFPWLGLPNVYALLGAGFAETEAVDGSYGYEGLVVDAGAGVLFPLMRQVMLRGDVRVRTDWHSDDAPGLDSFVFEPVAHVGVLIPLGGAR